MMHSATAFQLYQRRIVIEQCLNVLRLHIVVCALCIQNLKQGHFTAVVAVYLPVEYRLRLLQDAVFVMLYLLRL